MFLLLLLFLPLAGIQAQQLRFDSVQARFPRLQQESEPYAVHYGFTNEGPQPVKITEVTLSCGCLSATYPEGEVAPGERGTVTVTFRPKGYIGPILREACVYTTHSGEEPAQCLILRGEVLPPSDPWYPYPHHLGLLRTKQKSVTFRIRGRSGKMVEAVVAVNSGKQPLHITADGLPPYLTFATAPATIEAGQESDLRFTLQLDALPPKVRQEGITLQVKLQGIGAPADDLPVFQIQLLP